MGMIIGFIAGVITAIITMIAFLFWRKKKFQEEIKKFTNLDKDKLREELQNIKEDKKFPFPGIEGISDQEIKSLMENFNKVISESQFEKNQFQNKSKEINQKEKKESSND